ncbi:hypothetical protein EVG20_g2755 [Dentipellis fragilis]|uniref:DUF6534 domain-containing protein n=1 Tax=Dentipellis fragilis TaxID=205917 RepID=A0A4Y9Z8V8_9AGAM|nr:hypothetical protein EVG20_g2755 [Dentipellis fragilis]
MPSLESTLDAALIGNFVAIMYGPFLGSASQYFANMKCRSFIYRLYGITTLQTYIYAQDYLEDPVALRLLVSAVWIIETIHSVLCLYSVHSMFVTNFGLASSPDILYWSQGAMILLGVIVMFAVHCYFARRVWMIGNNPQPLTAVIVLVASLHLVFGIATFVLTRYFDTWSAMRSRPISQVMLCGGLGSACVADLLIAASLFYYMRQRRSTLQHAQFHNALSSLTIYIVSTGFSTAVLSSSTLLTFMFVPHRGVFLGLASIQSKAYANAFLTNLNARQTIRNRIMRSGAAAGEDGDDNFSAEFTTVLLGSTKTSTRLRTGTSTVSAATSGLAAGPGSLSPSAEVTVMTK